MELMLFEFCCTSQLNPGTESDFSRIFLAISGADVQPEDEDI